MKTRGEIQYIKMPFFAAKQYDNLTSVRGVNKGFEDIASFLVDNIKQGRILDIGTGPGRLLYEINKKNSLIDLYGLDISSAMIELAKQHLKGILNVDLRVGNIVHTGYDAEYFDCIVSTGSFYNWDKPVEGLNEVFRILKKGSKAYIFESYKDHNKNELSNRLKENLQGYNPIRKRVTKYFLARQLKMTYSFSEFHNIVNQTDFKGNYRIEKVEIGNLPIYVRIELMK